jgi:hypothetical protein
MPAIAHKFVTIIFTEDSLSCCWLESSFAKATKDTAEHGVAPLVLRAYKQYPLNNLELAHLTLFNPTVIKKHITSFLCEHNLQDAFVAFALHGPVVHEQFVTLPTSTPHYTDFNSAQNNRNVVYEYRYLYPHHNGQFVFYVYSVPRSVVLQYQLLAVAAQCNLITITTQTMALLSAYQHMFGSAFRRTQLAVDMMRCNNNIGDLITVDAIKRMVDMSLPAEALAKEGAVNVSQDDYLRCAVAAGLFWSERLK